MKPGDLVMVDAPVGWGKSSLTFQCHGKVGLFLGELADGWCSLLIDGRRITLYYLALKVIDEAG